MFLPGESRGQRGLAGVVHGVAESDRLSATHLNPPLQEAWSLISLLSGHHEAPCLPPYWSAAHSRLVAELGSLWSCPRVHRGAPEVSGRDCFELILMDRPQEGQCAPSCPSSRGQPPMRGRHRVVLTLSSADLRPWLCFLLGLSGSSPVSLSCGPSSVEQRRSKLVAGCKLVAQGRPTGQSCANRCDRGVAWLALDVFSGRSSVQGGSHSFSSCSCPERGGRSRRPVCVCVCV